MYFHIVSYSHFSRRYRIFCRVMTRRIPAPRTKGERGAGKKKNRKEACSIRECSTGSEGVIQATVHYTRAYFAAVYLSSVKLFLLLLFFFFICLFLFLFLFSSVSDSDIKNFSRLCFRQSPAVDCSPMCGFSLLFPHVAGNFPLIQSRVPELFLAATFATFHEHENAHTSILITRCCSTSFFSLSLSPTLSVSESLCNRRGFVCESAAIKRCNKKSLHFDRFDSSPSKHLVKQGIDTVRDRCFSLVLLVPLSKILHKLCAICVVLRIQCRISVQLCDTRSLENNKSNCITRQNFRSRTAPDVSTLRNAHSVEIASRNAS